MAETIQGKPDPVYLRPRQSTLGPTLGRHTLLTNRGTRSPHSRSRKEINNTGRILTAENSEATGERAYRNACRNAPANFLSASGKLQSAPVGATFDSEPVYIKRPAPSGAEKLISCLMSTSRIVKNLRGSFYRGRCPMSSGFPQSVISHSHSGPTSAS